MWSNHILMTNPHITTIYSIVLPQDRTHRKWILFHEIICSYLEGLEYQGAARVQYLHRSQQHGWTRRYHNITFTPYGWNSMHAWPKISKVYAQDDIVSNLIISCGLLSSRNSQCRWRMVNRMSYKIDNVSRPRSSSRYPTCPLRTLLTEEKTNAK